MHRCLLYRREHVSLLMTLSESEIRHTGSVFPRHFESSFERKINSKNIIKAGVK